MTRDYAKRKRPARRRKAQSQVPGWVWLFTGCVLGGFVTFLVYLSDAPTPSAPEKEQRRPATASLPPEPEPEPTPKPRFDFYKLLKESEVIVPATEPESRASGRERSPAQPRQETEPDERKSLEEYVLQVGSFRNNQDADRLRAQLILLNLDAHIEKVTLNDNQIWHRVLVGPFDNQSRLASARGTLVSNDYNALVLKRQPGN